MTKCAAVVVALLGVSCERLAGTKPSPPPPAPVTPLDEARTLIEQGQPEAALAKLAEAPADAESLYLQGAAWARKAETAPLPTPAPVVAPLPRGAEAPAAAEFKPEELTALEFFGKAVAARPDYARAQLSIAELLAPHAAHRYETAQAAQRAWSRKGKRPDLALAPEPGVPDFRAERIVEAYRAALLGDPASKEAAVGLARFCLRVGRLEDAEAALRELINRDKENPEHLVRYGDFLVNQRKDPMGAVDQYRQVLIWRPDDDETRGKIADVFVAQGIEHYVKQEYAVAEARFAEAEKFITDRASPRGIKIQDYLGRLRSIRPKAGR